LLDVDCLLLLSCVSGDAAAARRGTAAHGRQIDQKPTAPG